MRVVVQKLISGGSGLASVNGKTVFIPYAAVGDELEIEIVKTYPDYLEAKIVKIITPSKDRALPLCPVFGLCGGCQWQHLSSETQLHWKREILLEAFERIAHMKRDDIEAKIALTLPSPKQWHYRNRIQLHVDSKERLGFYRPRSKEVVEFEKCYIADERLNEQLQKEREYFRKRGKGVALRLDESEASFLQINSEQNQVLRKTLIEWVNALPHRRVVELYAGEGNFSFEIAKKASEVIAVEVDKRAVDSAQKKAFQEKRAQLHFYAAEAAEVEQFVQGEVDLLVLDPPRKGAFEALEAIVKVAPSFMIYVSCNPSTLARDIAWLQKHGYMFQKSLPIDMFPQTHHIESMTLLKKLKKLKNLPVDNEKALT